MTKPLTGDIVLGGGGKYLVVASYLKMLQLTLSGTIMMSLRSLVSIACVSLLTFVSAHAKEPDQVIIESASEAISAYKESGNVEHVSRMMPNLMALSDRASKDAGARGVLMTVCADLLNALYETADLRFRVDKLPKLNIAVPGGKYPSGIDPRSIEDPAVRAEYEKALEANRRYADYYGKQTAVYREIDRLAQLLSPGGNTASIINTSALLKAQGMGSAYDDDFRKRMEKVATR